MNPQKPLAKEQPKFIGKMLARAEQKKQQSRKSAVSEQEVGEARKQREEPEVIMTPGYRKRLEELQKGNKS